MKTFSLGILLGLVELVPGISAASIALVFNIYERIVRIIAQVNLKNISLLGYLLLLHKRKSRRMLAVFSKKFDLSFLGLLFLGQIVAFLLFPNLLNYLLKNYEIYVLALFTVFIIISLTKTCQSYKGKVNFSFFWCICGIIFFFLLKGVIGQFRDIDIHSYQYFFLGLLIICFMMLPGISGSFVLLLLGEYDFIISLIANLSKGNFIYLDILVFFLCGLICGAIFFARIINYLLINFSEIVLNFLLSCVCISFLYLLFIEIEFKELSSFFLSFLFFFCFFYLLSNYFSKKMKNYNE